MAEARVTHAHVHGTVVERAQHTTFAAGDLAGVSIFAEIAPAGAFGATPVAQAVLKDSDQVVVLVKRIEDLK